MAEEPWSGEKELKKEFKDILAKKPPISASIVGNITKIALQNIDQCYKQVVLQIERFISKVAPEYRLSGLYLLDSIVKQANKKYGPENQYRLRFSQNLAATVERCFDCVSKDKEKVQKVLRIWLSEGIFPDTVSQRIERVINQRTGGHSRTSEPPPSPPRGGGSPPPFMGQEVPKFEPVPEPQPDFSQQFSTLSGLLGLPTNQLGGVLNQWGSPSQQGGHQNHHGGKRQDYFYSDEESSDDDATRLNKLQQRREQEEINRLAEEEKLQAAGGGGGFDGFNQLASLHSLLQNLNPEAVVNPQVVQPNNNNNMQPNQMPAQQNNQGFPNNNHQPAPKFPAPTGPYVRQIDPSQPRQLRRGIPPGGEYGGDLPNGQVRVFTKTLFVGNLAPNVTEKMLQTVFANCGPLQSLKYKAEKHYAFITYETRRDAEIAKQKTHSYEIEGRPMKVGWGRGWVQNTTEEEFDYEQGLSFIPREILGITEQEYPVTLIPPEDLAPKPQPIQQHQPQGRQQHHGGHHGHPGQGPDRRGGPPPHHDRPHAHQRGGDRPPHDLNRSNEGRGGPPPQHHDRHVPPHHDGRGGPPHQQQHHDGRGGPPQQHHDRPHELNRSNEGRPPQQHDGPHELNRSGEHDRPPRDFLPHGRPHDRPPHERFPPREPFDGFDRRPDWPHRGGPPPRWDGPPDFSRPPPRFDDRRDDWRRDDRGGRDDRGRDRRDDRRDDRHERRKRSRSGSPDRRNSPSRKKIRRSQSPPRRPPHLSHSQDNYY